MSLCLSVGKKIYIYKKRFKQGIARLKAFKDIIYLMKNNQQNLVGMFLTVLFAVISATSIKCFLAPTLSKSHVAVMVSDSHVHENTGVRGINLAMTKRHMWSKYIP